MNITSHQARCGLLFVCAILTLADSAVAQNYNRRRSTAQPTKVWSYGYGGGSESVYSESVRDYSPPARVAPARPAPAKRPAAAHPSAAPTTAAPTAATSGYSTDPLQASPSAYSPPTPPPPEQPVTEAEIAAFVAKTKELRRYPSSSMPIKVYFPQRATPLDAQCRHIALSAMDEWARASDGFISYKEVSSKNGANIVIHWRPYNPKTDSQGAGGKRMGWTQTCYSGDDLRSSDVRLHTLGNTLYMDVALHEIGHALGFEHTPWADSIMNANHNNHSASISQNDKAVLAAVYGKPETAEAAKSEQWQQPSLAPASE